MTTDAVDALQKVWLFQGLDRTRLSRLARSFTERELPAGSVIVEQGQTSGIGFFILVEGEAAVTVDGREVAKLRPGDHFGEIALLSDRVRTATVTALTDVRVLVMVVWDFRAYVRGDPEVAWKLLQHVAGLLHARQPEHELSVSEAP